MVLAMTSAPVLPGPVRTVPSTLSEVHATNPLASGGLVSPFFQRVVPTSDEVCQQIAGSALPPTRQRDCLSDCRRIIHSFIAGHPHRAVMPISP
jgi:hypothetical protein